MQVESYITIYEEQTVFDGKIEDAIKRNYQPYGKPSVIRFGDKVRVLQAMVRYKFKQYDTKRPGSRSNQH